MLFFNFLRRRRWEARRLLIDSMALILAVKRVNSNLTETEDAFLRRALENIAFAITCLPPKK